MIDTHVHGPGDPAPAARRRRLCMTGGAEKRSVELSSWRLLHPPRGLMSRGGAFRPLPSGPTRRKPPLKSGVVVS